MINQEPQNRHVAWNYDTLKFMYQLVVDELIGLVVTCVPKMPI
jgi:hypothetical protein